MRWTDDDGEKYMFSTDNLYNREAITHSPKINKVYEYTKNFCEF